jgi:hypothetical protein
MDLTPVVPQDDRSALGKRCRDEPGPFVSNKALRKPFSATPRFEMPPGARRRRRGSTHDSSSQVSSMYSIETLLRSLVTH